MPAKYYLFLDECGDQSLSNFDPSFPIFTLCGIIFSQEQLELVSTQVSSLKHRFWSDQKIILHSRDIRKCQNGFELLFDLNTKQNFYESLNRILGASNYKVICCSIRKEQYIRKYGRMNDVYAQSLSFIIERAVFYLDSLGINDIELNVIIERRGKKEDNNLLSYYNQLIDRGTYYVSPDRIKGYFKSFAMRQKREDVIGLQIADLVAYPITRYILDSSAVNLSFNIIKRNIYTRGGKQYGLKVFP